MHSRSCMRQTQPPATTPFPCNPPNTLPAVPVERWYQNYMSLYASTFGPLHKTEIKESAAPKQLPITKAEIPTTTATAEMKGEKEINRQTEHTPTTLATPQRGDIRRKGGGKLRRTVVTREAPYCNPSNSSSTTATTLSVAGQNSINPGIATYLRRMFGSPRHCCCCKCPQEKLNEEAACTLF
eukprot:TRINITY_DN20167_c0_g2_i1.p1 TRINITY_DN20167_c0_g2~~TRINITY_DN20167_c0_g2_i1.p1  ORF type:complete len:183 (+),score=26.77 TRINITY_DN20167_c0_g2_i1:56-604(+)